MKARFRGLASTAALAVMVLAGCAQNVGDINRVQPNYVKKSDFNGEWYLRQTVVDVPPQVEFSFVGQTLDMEKIYWEITESHLVAYRAYELYPGMNPEVDDANKQPGSTPTDGNQGYYGNPGQHHDAPIMAFRIQSHFDIQRQYNPATGEQTNVISENQSDRPWYERKYMRVDWGRNDITNYAADIGQEPGSSGGIQFAEYVQESEGGQFAFRMQDADGNPVVLDPTDPAFADRKAPEYFDVVRRFYTAPPTIDYYGTQYPACWFLGYTYDCAGGEVKVRTSALKVPEAKTYEPRVYDDARMNKFGFFRTERVTYNDRRGTTDEGQIFLANIHNLWETAYDQNGNVLLPAKRTPKPVVYALSPGFPAELIPAAEETARGWAKAYTRAVAAAMGKSIDEIFKNFPYEDANGNYKNEGLFRIDYNEDAHAQIGDLRYNFMYWVASPQLTSPLGYGPSSVDPESGEIIAGQAYVYGAAIDTYAQFAMDLVDMLNGTYTFDDVTSGAYVKDYIKNNRDRMDPRVRMKQLGLDAHLQTPIADALKAIPNLKAKLAALRQFGPDEIGEGFSQRLARIKGTSLESYLVNNEIRSVVANRTGNAAFAHGNLDDALLDASSPYTLDLAKQQKDEEARRDWASRNSLWLADFTDGSIMGLAQEIKDKGLSGEEAYQWLRKTIFEAVIEHEVGHTLGLRHNFQGSFDSINYFDQYWQLRKENLQPSLQTLDDLAAMSNLTPNQEAGKMREYQYSSIMDYGSRFNSDIHGLGKYDEAAILFGYADYVEVFDTAGQAFKNRYFERYSDGSPRFENRGSLAYDSLLDSTHYTQIPYMMGDNDPDKGIQRLAIRDIRPYETVKTLQAEQDPNRPVEVPYMFCSDEWRGAIPSCQLWDEGADMYEQVHNVIDSWRNYYVLNNFRRDRWGWDPYSTFRRSFSRYFSYLPNLYQHWLLGAAYGTVDEDIQSIYEQFATMDGVNFLTEVLEMPEYGTQCFDAANNRYQDPSDYYYDHNYTNCTETMDVPQGVGRRQYSRYPYDGGYYYYKYPLEAGHFWDKIAALEALAQTDATVRGVETQSDFSTYIIPYSYVVGEELTSVYNSLITDDYSVYSPRLVPQAGGEGIVFKPTVDYMGLTEDANFGNLPYIIPPVNFTDKFYAMLYGMSAFDVNGDFGYADTHKVFRLGSGETLEPAAGYDVVRFEDDTSGAIYAVLQKSGTEPTGAAKFVADANAYKAERDLYQQQAADAEQAGDTNAADEYDSLATSMQNKIDNIVEFMNIERGMYEVFGRF